MLNKSSEDFADNPVSGLLEIDCELERACERVLQVRRASLDPTQARGGYDHVANASDPTINRSAREHAHSLFAARNKTKQSCK